MDGRKITRLVVQQNDPNRVNVWLDGEFAFGVMLDAAVLLSVGQVLTDAKIAELIAEDRDEMIFRKAVRYLDYRPRSEKEIRKKLSGLDCSETEIGKVLDRLREIHLVDDEDFAERWVDERSSSKPRSRRMLQYELRKKGIPEEMIQTALENVDDSRSAFELARGRMARWEGLEYRDFKKKLGSFLAGKGYSWDTVSRTADRIWREMTHTGTDSDGEECEDVE